MSGVHLGVSSVLTRGLVGFPCFFGRYFVLFIRIFDDYVIPAVLATLTLAILIGIFIPISQILATHKERTSDRCVDGILPVLAIVGKVVRAECENLCLVMLVVMVI